ncbi:PQ loop repeat-domain-containing protein [Chaetomium sp. MPI-SDFR-AT-0129]|nr:PQ loop repeat-domain-containing protein [Chaetomium sp. MPI-SDFR-AT-0129]
MAPPTGPLNLDVEAISGICGSISIACWVVVFSPQIIENFRRRSAEGLSIQFVVVWLLGDVFNILGAVLQGVLPTMLILAIYYTIADIVLMAQCFYYRGFTLRDDVPTPPAPISSSKAKRSGDGNGHSVNGADERTALLNGTGTTNGNSNGASHSTNGTHERAEQSPYYHSINEHDERRGSWTHLSPAVPFVSGSTAEDEADTPSSRRPTPRTTLAQAAAFNSFAILMVCAAGVAGWWLSRRYNGDNDHKKKHGEQQDPLEFNTLGQVFGWLCAVFYLGSRLPQLLLNWRRKSTEGVSVLFFLFACLGNLTYVLSILTYEPDCGRGGKGGHGAHGGHGRLGKDGCQPGEAGQIFWQYLLVNLSWLAGSAGTLLLDMSIFVQFFVYSKGEEEEEDEESASSSSSDEEEGLNRVVAQGVEEGEDEEHEEEERWDLRPLLQRNHTGY